MVHQQGPFSPTNKALIFRRSKVF